jgi:hypothetical protein
MQLVFSLGRVVIMSFSIKDSVLSFIEKDIINTVLIRICINAVIFPIYCVLLIILQKEYLDLMTEVEGLHTQLNDALTGIMKLSATWLCPGNIYGHSENHV